jgi:hypothetical protein
MSKWFTVTIDTEGDRACPFFGNRWGPLTGTYHSVLKGIPRLRSIWNRLSIVPAYLASAEVLASRESLEVLQREQQAGAEIGTHLHIDSEFPCNVPEERQHLQVITDLYERAFGAPPCSYRAGRYGVNGRTLATLRELGYRVDTSVTPHIDWSAQGGPDHTTCPIQPYWVEDILEVPVTIIGLRDWWPFNGWSRYRWLRPTVATCEQLKWIVDCACDVRFTVLNMMFHTMEIIPGASPYVRTSVGTQLYLRRLERTIAYMMHRGFEPITLSSLHSAWSRQSPSATRETVCSR